MNPSAASESPLESSETIARTSETLTPSEVQSLRQLKQQRAELLAKAFPGLKLV